MDGRHKAGHDGWIAGLIAAILALAPVSAHAHPGDHSGFSWTQLVEHLFEPDHFVFLALIVIAAVLAYRIGRRAGAREQARREP